MTGAIYLGTEQFLTLVAVLGVLGAVLIFLAKHQFNEITGSIKENQKNQQTNNDNNKKDLQESQKRAADQLAACVQKIQLEIQKNNDKVNERIDKLQEATSKDVELLKQELSNVKGDFATSFVLREDFFRAMNGVEDNIRETGRKVDKLLMLMGDKK